MVGVNGGFSKQYELNNQQFTQAKHKKVSNEPFGFLVGLRKYFCVIYQCCLLLFITDNHIFYSQWSECIVVYCSRSISLAKSILVQRFSYLVEMS